MKRRILAASPVQQNPDILERFLEFLTYLDTDDLELEYLFYDDNRDATSSELLAEFGQRQGRTLIKRCFAESSAYRKDENTHYWNLELIDKVAAMKDEIISYAIEGQYEALFLVDSDVLLHPRTLVSLLEADRPIISSIFWTKWQNGAEELPQVWLSDEYRFVHPAGWAGARATEERSAEERAEEDAFLQQLRRPGVYEVGGLGACTLIRRDALEGGVRYRRLPNVSFWGEDRHFSIRAAALGYGMYVDTRFPAYHLYRQSDLSAVNGYRHLVLGQPSRITVSFCLIVRDEEAVIERCLKSVEGFADEIIVVDTGSNDRTRDIAATCTPHVYDFQWIDDFSAARNYSFSLANGEYIFWLDANDILEETERMKLIELKAGLREHVDSVMMDYYLKRDPFGKPMISVRKNRLVKRMRGFRWIGAIHESLEVSGTILQSDIAVILSKERMNSDRNLRIYRRKLDGGEAFSPRERYYYANELREQGRLEEAAEQYEEFLATKKGWIEDNIAACNKLSDCYGRLSDRDRELASLLRSFEFDKPRASSCCQIGAWFMADNQYELAAYWYLNAAEAGEPPRTGGVVDHASWTWLPYLQLCVCYDRLGLYGKANECNELALRYHPTHPSMLYNRNYLKGKLASEAAETNEAIK